MKIEGKENEKIESVTNSLLLLPNTIYSSLDFGFIVTKQ